MSAVVYSLIRWPEAEGGNQYWLLRWENDATELVAHGVGLPMRRRIVAYLLGIVELDGPDAAAAGLALRRGWAVGRPPAGDQ